MSYFKKLEEIIKGAYEGGYTLDEAEKHAARFLEAQLTLASELRDADLDSRMKKSGLKAIKAAVYMHNATKSDKKPSDVMLEAVVNQDADVSQAQNAFDAAEVNKNEIETRLSVCREAHIFFRGVSRGKYE